MRYLAGFLLLLFATMLAPVPGSAQHVLLVRHAEKADDGTDNPPLTAEGASRAAALADLVAFSRLDGIISTPFIRCMDTARPASEISSVPIAEVGVDGGMEAHIAAVAAAVRAYGREDRVLVVGHSNTLPMIIEALGGPALEQIDDDQYDRLFLLDLTREGGGFGEMRWGAPPP